MSRRHRIRYGEPDPSTRKVLIGPCHAVFLEPRLDLDFSPRVASLGGAPAGRVRRHRHWSCRADARADVEAGSTRREDHGRSSLRLGASDVARHRIGRSIGGPWDGDMHPGVERQACDRLPSRRDGARVEPPQKRKGNRHKQGLNPTRLLEIDRSHLEVCLQVRESPQGADPCRPATVRSDGEPSLVIKGQDSVTTRLRGKSHGIDVIRQLEATARLLHVPRLGAGPAATPGYFSWFAP